MSKKLKRVESDNVPTGCCPPIFYCNISKENAIKPEKNVTKAFSASEIVSIKSIMEERRKDIKPFIILD
jgi:hypothetical protein